MRRISKEETRKRDRKVKCEKVIMHDRQQGLCQAPSGCARGLTLRQMPYGEVLEGFADLHEKTSECKMGTETAHLEHRDALKDKIKRRNSVWRIWSKRLVKQYLAKVDRSLRSWGMEMLVM